MHQPWFLHAESESTSDFQHVVARTFCRRMAVLLVPGASWARGFVAVSALLLDAPPFPFRFVDSGVVLDDEAAASPLPDRRGYSKPAHANSSGKSRSRYRIPGTLRRWLLPVPYSSLEFPQPRNHVRFAPNRKPCIVEGIICLLLPVSPESYTEARFGRAGPLLMAIEKHDRPRWADSHTPISNGPRNRWPHLSALVSSGPLHRFYAGLLVRCWHGAVVIVPHQPVAVLQKACRCQVGHLLFVFWVWRS